MSDKPSKAQAQEELKDYALGVPGRPYPMMHPVKGEDGRIRYELGVLEDAQNPLGIHTQRDYAEVVGMAYRDMPTPNMLRLFLEGNQQRDPSDPRKVEFYMGHPGAGKSFLANLHGKMRDKRGAMLVDCGGRDLGELLYETVLDYEAGKSVYDEIDGRLAKGTLNPASIKLLEKNLGEAFSRDGDKIAVDWNNVSDAEKAVNAVKQVADMEGLGKSGDASIGLTTVEGPIIKAWREGRPLILDEYNKAKPGTDDALQVLWQVFNGEMDQHTIKGGGGKEFTFKRSEMPQNFFVTLTGNMTKDGYSTRSLSASAYQRLQPRYIDEPGIPDWQHRICQKLTGMPVSTIYHANEAYWKEHKEEFTDFLVGMRKRGLSEEQQANIPSWQFEMLKNWDRVLQASEQLATFYDKWAQVVDPDSQLHQDAEMGNNAEVAMLQSEIDERYRDEVGVGLRRMLRHVDQATILKAKAVTSKSSKGVTASADFDLPPDIARLDPEAIEKRFGTRLSDTVLEDLTATADGKDRLLDWLLKQSAQAGLFEMVLEEGRTTGDKLISNLLDLDPELMKNVPENIEEIHSLLCEHIRKAFPNEELSENNADLISPAQLEHILTELGGRKEIERASERSGVLQIPNEDAKTLGDMPLVPSVATDAPMREQDLEYLSEDRKAIHNKIIEEEKGLEDLDKLPTEALVGADRLLVSFALPKVGGQNIKALWSEYSFDCSEFSAEQSIDAVASNQSEATGLATQLLKCKVKDDSGKEREEFLYVVHDGFANRKEGQTLVTGTMDISPALKDALEKNHITYVNRKAPEAEKAIDTVLGAILKEKSDVQGANMPIERTLTLALCHRITWERGDKEYYSLPNQELLDSDHTSPPVVPPAERAKDRENLVALISDRDQYLDKAKDVRKPFVATSSPDLDKLKHTVRHLTQKGGEQEKAATGRA